MSELLAAGYAGQSCPPMIVPAQRQPLDTCVWAWNGDRHCFPENTSRNIPAADPAQCPFGSATIELCQGGVGAWRA